jgi:hypothetical protein
MLPGAGVAAIGGGVTGIARRTSCAGRRVASRQQPSRQLSLTKCFESRFKI